MAEVPHPSGPPRGDARRKLLLGWEQGCRVRGTELGPTTEALFLVTALLAALRAGTETPELGRAARTWGCRFSNPTEALSVFLPLREALFELDEPRTPSGLPEPGGPLEADAITMTTLLDEVMTQVVDAASTHLRAVALEDPLTRCANRRALDEDLPRAILAARHSGLDLAVAAVDLDGLKAINDERGHPAGDAALLALVDALHRELRDADTLYRAGGDEFVVVAPFTGSCGARSLMGRAEAAGAPLFSWGVADLGELTHLGDVGGGGDVTDDPDPTERGAAGRAEPEDAAGRGVSAASLAPASLAPALLAPALLAAADADLYQRRAQRRSASLPGAKRGAGVLAQLRRSRSTALGTEDKASSTSSEDVVHPRENRTA